ncbi:uncharacterized protein [Dysidea avara]|uniref:uncharacterized protein n=1 Tax=Dysidea avara TaxID=196820 RepID=UPI00331EB93F
MAEVDNRYYQRCGQSKENFEDNCFASLSNNIQYKNYNGVMHILMIVLIFLGALMSESFQFNIITLIFALQLVCIWVMICSMIAVNVRFMFYNGRYLFCNTTVTLMWNLTNGLPQPSGLTITYFHKDVKVPSTIPSSVVVNSERPFDGTQQPKKTAECRQGIILIFAELCGTSHSSNHHITSDIQDQSGDTSTPCLSSIPKSQLFSLQLPVQNPSSTPDNESLPHNESVVSISDDDSSNEATETQEPHQPNCTISNTAVPEDAIDHSDIVHDAGGLMETTSYATSTLPGTTESCSQHYGTGFDKDHPLSREESKKYVQLVPKEKDIGTILESHHTDEISLMKSSYLQVTTKPSAIPRTSTNVGRPQRFPRRACVVYKNEQYSLDHELLSLPRATKYLVKVRTEISPGRFMAKLELHCASEDEKPPNLDVTATTSNEQIVPVRERKHFRSNINKTGYVIFSSDLESFSGHIQYPLPNKRATASRIGYGGNAIVFVVFHAGKEFAVKKTVYRSKEISVHSQLCHPNIINLEAVLVGEKHERHRDKYYVYCFMQKMDINFRNILSSKDHGCLTHFKMKVVEKKDQWETVLLNIKHVLRSVLKALDYIHGQGLIHRDVKASNILIKTTCQCSEVLYCSCQHKFIVQLGDFDSSATVPGYQLHLEEHQMIRYASVLPLGTMGYRAPEVSMHLVLSGPYEVLYTTGVDIWSFGCLLLAIFIGKSGPLKQRGEASLLLSAQDHPYSQELYHKIIKIPELRKYYANVPGACDLAEKCLQVQPHCRPTAKELLQLDFLR